MNQDRQGEAKLQTGVRPARRGWRRVAFPLLAVGCGLLPFVLLEILLVAFNLGQPSSDPDPLAGFSRVSPLFELEPPDDSYRTARSRQLYFGQQQFARQKPPGTFRMFALGGSTVRGRPYDTETAFLKWLEIELNGCDTSRRYESVNCGGESYASYRLVQVLREVRNYQPDLIIVASGHNEFLEDRTYQALKHQAPLVRWFSERAHRLRTVSLLRQLAPPRQPLPPGDNDPPVLSEEVAARLDQQSGYASYRRDPQWRRQVMELYEQSLREMVEICRQASVPLVLVNLGENLRDCPPFKSEHGDVASGQQLQQWQSYFDAATELEEIDAESALALYRRAQQIDDQHALLSYRIARCLDRLGRTKEAGQSYQQARQLDVCPLRMVDELHEIVCRVARETGTPLVNAEQILRDISPQGIPGNNCFMDHVHPSIGAHQRIARTIAAELVRAEIVPQGNNWSDQDRRAAYRDYFVGLGPVYLANGRRRVGWLENWARRHRLYEETLPIDAGGHERMGMKLLDFNEINQAWEHFQKAMKEDAEVPRRLLAHALDLFQQGRGEAAEEVLLRLHDEPAAQGLQPQVILALLIVALDGGRTQAAARLYSASREDLTAAARDSHGWLDLLPDALERSKQAAEKE